MRITYCIILIILGLQLSAQNYTDYLGAGHSLGMTVTSSDDSGNSSAMKTIDGAGLDADLFDASRFIAQASFGASRADIESLAETLDFEGWIDAQIALPQTDFLATTEEVWDTVLFHRLANGYDPDEVSIHGARHLEWNYSWWQALMDGDDQLRQKIAYALSQIFVISNESDLRGFGFAVASYYDLFMDNSFGNVEDLLMDVTLSVPMGFYLSHLNNPKEDLEENIHPDQNYAREIMQLFTIGLYELNQDGSRKKAANGDDIPTYDNDDIIEMANVFTGLGPGGVMDFVTWTNDPYFGLGMHGADKTVPMVMYENFHETKEKVILDGDLILPANQAGMTDIQQAINFLFNHENTPPFLSRLLIQRLVKSNPSPAYISRVSDAFIDNGSGVRGDMEAIVKAILLDAEARECAPMQDEFAPRMREPVTKYIHISKALALDSPLGRYWNSSFNFLNNASQMTLYSPSVFNFYSPDYHPVGLLANNGYKAPEFFLHNTSTATGYINQVYSWTFWNSYLYSWEDNYGDIDVDLVTDELHGFADEPEKLMNELDIRYTHGQLTDETRTIIRSAIEGVPNSWSDYDYQRTRVALYLMFISPDYNIMR